MSLAAIKLPPDNDGERPRLRGLSAIAARQQAAREIVEAANRLEREGVKAMAAELIESANKDKE